MNALDRLDALLDQQVSTRSIATVRVLVGLIAAWYLRPIAVAAWGDDVVQDRFHDPFLAMPVLPPGPFAVAMTIGFVAALATAAGRWTRPAVAITAASVGYHLSIATIHLHNNRAYLFAALVGLALAPCGRSLSLDRWWALRRGRPAAPERMAAWPLWLLRFECSLVYAASGCSKLVDPDWFGGTVTWGRVVAGEAMLRASALPTWIQDLFLDRSFHTVAAKVIVLTELAIAAGFWARRTRPFAVVAAIGFHVSIELSASVQTFSYLAVAMLFVWADPAGVRWAPAGAGRFRRVPV